MKHASKKKVRKITEDLDSPPPVKREADEFDTAYFISEATLNEQPEPSRPAPTEEPPAPAAMPPPLAPMAALWPTNTPSPPTSSKPSQPQARTVQKNPVAVTEPKPPAPLSPAQSTPTTPAKSAVVVQTPVPQTPKTVNVSFTLVKIGAKHVSLCGEFNGWSPGATPLKQHNDGHWETTIALAPGRYQYKFLVDGEWLLDSGGPKTVPNEHGTLNSVIEVRA